MENSLNNTKPADYIDIATLHPPKTRTSLDRTMLRVAKQFYQQEFTTKNLFVAIEQDGGIYASRADLYANVRTSLPRLAKQGEFTCVHKGKAGHGNPSKFRNKEHV